MHALPDRWRFHRHGPLTISNAHCSTASEQLTDNFPMEEFAVSLQVTIEIPKGSRNKYEVDHETGKGPGYGDFAERLGVAP